MPINIVKMGKKEGNRDRVVYSTNLDLVPDEESQEEDSPPSSEQTLYVSLERLKGGKVATVIENFVGKKADLEELGKLLRNKCGSGGSVKEGVIIVQGQQRDKVIGILNSLGFKTKKKGG